MPMPSWLHERLTIRPFCGLSVKSIATLIAICEIVLGIMSIVVVAFFLRGMQTGGGNVFRIIRAILGAIVMISGHVLIFGFRRESVGLLRGWIKFRLAVLCMEIIIRVVGFSEVTLKFDVFQTIASLQLIAIVYVHRQNIRNSLNGNAEMGTARSRGSQPDQPEAPV